MTRHKSGQLRIIGGHWRGRRLRFAASSGVRPTPDHVRETLFNWLAPIVHRSRCLDLYAGSGALGIEALSRGAAAVDFVDSSRSAVEAIRDALHTLDVSSVGAATVSQNTAERYVGAARDPWDIVFLDPPFGQDLAFPMAQTLLDSTLIREDGLIYVETERTANAPTLRGAELHKEKSHGASTSRLYRVEQAATSITRSTDFSPRPA